MGWPMMQKVTQNMRLPIWSLWAHFLSRSVANTMGTCAASPVMLCCWLAPDDNMLLGPCGAFTLLP